MITPLSGEVIANYLDMQFPGVKPITIIKYRDLMKKSLNVIAQEAQRDTLRQVVEWGEGICPHASYRNSSNVILHEKRRYCKKCWQELKKQVEVSK